MAMRLKAWMQFFLMLGVVFALAGAAAFGLYRLSGSLPVFWAALYVTTPVLAFGLASLVRRTHPELPVQRFHPFFYLGYAVIAAGGIVRATGYATWGSFGFVLGALLLVVGMRRSGTS
jgi:hypothetical protein